MVAAHARLGELANASREILADPRYRPKLLLVELDDGLRPGCKRFGGGAVGAYFEGIVASDLEEVGDLGKNL
jgi:hypothetical protein